MPAPLHALDYEILLCEDLARMQSFYKDTPGLAIERDWENWIEMRAGTVRLTRRRRGRPYDGPGTQGAAVQLAFRVLPADVDAWYAQLIQKRCRFLNSPQIRGTAPARYSS